MFEVSKIMERGFSFVNRETHIYVALNLLVKEVLPGLPVVDEQMRVIGIITEREVLRILVSEEVNDNQSVEDYMATDFRAFDATDSAVDVCDFFMSNPGCSMVPILEDGKFAGVIRHRDIIYLILHIRGKIYSKNR